MIGSSLSPRHQSFGQVCQSYLQLTKPRIIPLLLATTMAAMWLAGQGHVPISLAIATLLGGSLAAAAAQTFNCVYDQDIDYEMLRTRKRPLPSGRIQVTHAVIFGTVLMALSFCVLVLFVNLLSALLAMAGIVFYMLIYTHFLKRHTSQNIVIGGAAGAIPPLVGWTAVTGELAWPAWLIFGIIFLWTPPHFWALALMIQDDYAQVNVPMLPVVAGAEVTVRQIWIYSWLTVAASLLLVYPLANTGWIYAISAIALGYLLLKKSWQLKQEPEDKPLAKGLFKYSIMYMLLLCAAIVLDSLPALAQLNQLVSQGVLAAFSCGG